MSVAYVDFSRDGQWMAYVTFPEGTLWRSRLDGTDRLQLTSPPVNPAQPRWSPDGRRIAFHGQALGQPMAIYLVSADGGPVELLAPADVAQFDPDFSPDGRTLAFGNAFWDHTAARPITVHFLDLQSRHVSTVSGSDGFFEPRWSPDGRMLVALSHDFHRLVLFDVQQGRWRELMSSGESMDWPAWSRDGRYVFIQEGRDYVRVRVADGGRELVVSLAGLRQANAWIDTARDGSVLTVQDVGVRELYALEWDRAYLYTPSLTRVQAIRETLGDLVHRFFEGSPEELVMGLIETRQLTPERVERLVARVEKRKGGSRDET
jgi:Tol biopolymer transport system component